jgi:hypothetical protein
MPRLNKVDIPIIALWISHRVLLTKELIGRRTSKGMPTDIKARRLTSVSDQSIGPYEDILRRYPLVNGEGMLNRNIGKRELSFMPR